MAGASGVRSCLQLSACHKTNVLDERKENHAYDQLRSTTPPLARRIETTKTDPGSVKRDQWERLESRQSESRVSARRRVAAHDLDAQRAASRPDR